MAVRLGVLGDLTQVDMIQTAAPGGLCPQACAHCGAFTSKDKGPQRQLNKDQLRENLTREIDGAVEVHEEGDVEAVREGVRGRIVADFLAPFVTTDVDVEPSDGDAFNDAAELVYDLTGGKSKMVCISHGRRVYYNFAPGAGDCSQLLKAFDSRLRVGLDADELLEKLRSLGINGELEVGMRALFDGKLDDGKMLSLRLNLVDELVKKGIMMVVVPRANQASSRRQDKTVSLMREGKVAGFILTVDVARSHGKIPVEANVASYVATLNDLKPALAPDCPAFVAISVQGLINVAHGHKYSYEKALMVFWEALKRSNLTDNEKRRLRYDDPRDYVKAGMAGENSELADYISDDAACEVIPFKDFVGKVIVPSRRGRILRARVNADGSVVHQFVQPGRTYNTTVEGPWTEFSDVGSIRTFAFDGARRALRSEVGEPVKTRLTRAAREAIENGSWEDELENESQIFLVKPFSLLRRRDRAKVLDYLKGALKVADLCQYMVDDEKAARPRKIRFSDLKMVALQGIYPENDLDRRIREAGPYREILERVSATAESVGLTMEPEVYYQGQIMAVAKGIEEKFPEINYLVKVLSKVRPGRGSQPDLPVMA